MSDLVERAWTRWSDSRPPNAPGKHRYRVKAKILGLDLMPEWTEAMTLCGMGHGDNEWWPLTSCHWDGYRRQITTPDLEWSEHQESDADTIVWGGLDLLPCPFTGAAPTVEAQGRYIGAPLWHSEALWISSPSVPQRRFTDAKAMVASWNRRAPDPELSRLSARVEELERAAEPFINVISEGVEDHPDDTKATLKLGRMTDYSLTLGDFRLLATAALEAALAPIAPTAKTIPNYPEYDNARRE